MKKLSNAAQRLKGQAMFQILTKARELERNGKEIFHFELGDPDFDTPEDIVVCNGETISSINFTGSNVSGTSFSWANDQASIGLDANGSGNIPDFTAKNNIIYSSWFFDALYQSSLDQKAEFNLKINLSSRLVLESLMLSLPVLKL